ncbi:hypothetical protein QFC24_002863 [Naganishia onofrii]|uniref:Uncharacterized protein n=1 Tax=Naganishia onofrii TaxID=1851511 RepID=A0ACC2XM55_9TREE|nr:hypothetical protein QFC24_002863 [Naganishia onofrii]
MMASCGESCTGKLGADLEWFKISQENYDPQTKTWPLAIPTGTKGIDTKFTLPTNLPGGQYLLSQTLIAMHSHDGAQYYVSAFEIDLQSDGASLPDLTMKIPAMYTEHRNDVTQFRFMVDRPDCYDFGLFRVPGVPVYDGSDSIAGDSNGNGAEEFDDQPLTVPATCPDQVPPPTVVGSILGAPAAGSGKPSSPAASNAPGGKPVTPASQPPKAPPAATPSSQAPPITNPSSPQTGGAPDTSGTSGTKDCQGIWVSFDTVRFKGTESDHGKRLQVTCNAASASLKDYAASMTAHGKCDTDVSALFEAAAMLCALPGLGC